MPRACLGPPSPDDMGEEPFQYCGGSGQPTFPPSPRHRTHLFAVGVGKQRRPFLLLRPLRLVAVHLLHHHASPDLHDVTRLHRLRKARIHLFATAHERVGLCWTLFLVLVPNDSAHSAVRPSIENLDFLP